MGYPNVIYGVYGDEKNAQSTKIGGLPLGQSMILPDGRKFRHAHASSAASLLAGVVVQGAAPVTGHGQISGSGLLASATTTENKIGDTAVYLTNKSVAITKNQYADGVLTVIGPAGSTAYIGRTYRIKENDSCAVSTKVKFTLYPEDPLVADMAPGSTLCAPRHNNFEGCIVFADTSPPAGVVPTAVSAGFYFWAQRSGDAACIQSATVCVDGDPVMCDTALAGSVTLTPTVAATADTAVISTAYNLSIRTFPIGIARGAGGASQAVIVDLRLE